LALAIAPVLRVVFLSQMVFEKRPNQVTFIFARLQLDAKCAICAARPPWLPRIAEGDLYGRSLRPLLPRSQRLPPGQSASLSYRPWPRHLNDRYLAAGESVPTRIQLRHSHLW